MEDKDLIDLVNLNAAKIDALAHATFEWCVFPRLMRSGIQEGSEEFSEARKDFFESMRAHLERCLAQRNLAIEEFSPGLAAYLDRHRPPSDEP